MTTYTRPQQYPSPEPTQTVTVTITQSVSVSNPSSFDGDASAIDYHTVEQDAQTAPASESSSITYDSYYAYTNTPFAGNFLYLGFNSADSYGNTASVVYGQSGDLADMLPEASGQNWTNPPTAMIGLVEPNNESSTQSIAADGSYMTTITYQDVNAQGTGRTTATVQNATTGAGSYDTPRLGTRQDSNYTYVVQPPSGGNISETTTIPPDAGSTATPDPVTTTVPDWITPNFPTFATALANETDSDMGSASLPASCAVPASLGTTANVILQTKNRLDPMLGQIEVTKTTNYVIPNVGVACVAIDDVLTYYYDFTGQNGVGYFSGSPQQVSELQEVLSLSAQSLTSVARTGGTRFAASRTTSRTFGARVELAQAHITTARAFERAAFLRSTALGRHFVAASVRHRGIL